MNRHAELKDMFKILRLPTMSDSFEETALSAAREGITHEAFLYELVRAECEDRQQRRIERLLKKSGLPEGKTFRTLDMQPFPPLVRQQLENLRKGEFLKDAVNIVAVGKPGVGKSHALASVGYELIWQGRTVLWVQTATLMQKLLAAKRDLRLPQMLASLDRFELLVLDDIGYVQHNRDEMEVLFTLLAERYERRSVAITTNLMFSEWERIFKNPMTTAAAIDRVVHHAVILDLMMTDSYRAKEAVSKNSNREQRLQEASA